MQRGYLTEVSHAKPIVIVPKRSPRPWMPFVGSFAVYLTPLVGPHAVRFLGEHLAASATRAERLQVGWLAAEAGLALAAQAVAGLVLAWSVRGSRLRLTVWFAALPLLTAGLNLAYLVALPSAFLIEADTSPQITTWEAHCFVPDVSLLSIRRPAIQPVEGVRAWWLQRPDGSFALLRMPGCEVVESGLPEPKIQPGGRVDFMIGLPFATADGVAVVEKTIPTTAERNWFLLSAPGAALLPLETPESAEGTPHLSVDGDAVGWLQRVAGSPRPILKRVIVRALHPTPEFEGRIVDLEPFGPASYTLLSVNVRERELLLWRNDRPIGVDFNGEGRPAPFDQSLSAVQATTYLRHHAGWVAWDAYREDEPYRVSWSLGGHAGARAANRGRHITSVAVDPSGLLIAMSETTSLNIGSAPDVVSVFRAADGVDVFRLHLPRYARSEVVFFSGDLFGYSDLRGTHILTVPALHAGGPRTAP